MKTNAACKGVSDAELVVKAVLIGGPVSALVKRLRTNARVLGGVARGAAAPPDLRRRLLQLVRAKGALAVPVPPARPGRQPSPTPLDGNLRVPLRPEEILAFEAQADRGHLTTSEALARAVRHYLDAHPIFDHHTPPVDKGTLGYRCRLDLGTLKELNRRCVFLGWRRVYLRAAVIGWTALMEQKGVQPHGQGLPAVA